MIAIMTNKCIIKLYNLIRGDCMGKTIDLTGQRFDKLTVLRKSERKGKNSYWICRCDCGVEKEICTTALKRGQKSCGCAAYDFAKDKIIGNKYTIDENNVVHVELRSGDEMLCDFEDWELLKKFTWTKNGQGYAASHDYKKNIRFHVEVKGKKDGYVIDHIDQNKLNNQKSNLRFVTKSGNAANSKLFKNNTSGVKGVVRFRNKWHAQITVNGKNIHLGYYDKMEDAIEARQKGENKYFKPLLENK